MPETLFQRLHGLWQRLLDRLPSSERGIEPELPVEAFGVATPAKESVKAPASLPASDRPESH